MYELVEPEQSWLHAKVRWAVMVEDRGIREWEEAGFLFRSEDFDSAFQRALAIGEGYQGGGEEGTRRPRWVENPRRSSHAGLPRCRTGRGNGVVLDAKTGAGEDPLRT